MEKLNQTKQQALHSFPLPGGEPTIMDSIMELFRRLDKEHGAEIEPMVLERTDNDTTLNFYETDGTNNGVSGRLVAQYTMESGKVKFFKQIFQATFGHHNYKDD